MMENDFDHIDEFDGGDVVAIGDPTAVILPAERNANEILAQIIMDGRRKIGTRKSYSKKISAFLKWLLECHPTHFDEASGSAILPVPPKIIAEFMAKISTVVDRKTKEPRSAAVSLVGSYRSALVWMYEKENMKFDDETSLTFSSFSGGYKRHVAEKKLNGEMKLKEGMSPITFNGYVFVAGEAMKQQRDHQQGIFAHLFLLLCWNLMARSVSVGSLMLQHISWESDSLLITTPKHKGDQEGNNCYPKHVYANTENPVICPILSMAILLFSGGWRRDGAKHMLFAGNATESRFGKWLRDLMEKHSNTVGVYGVTSFEIGTHSFRKGVATFVAGCPAGPSPISIFLRAGWSLGAVTARYIFAGQGGDQFVGRAASGLSLTDRNFAALPPHFLPGETALSRTVYDDILPGFRDYPECFKTVTSYLLASLVYHRKFISENLPSDHPLFLSRVWTTGIIDRLESKLLAGCGRNEKSSMTATGVPPTLVIANQMEVLSDKFESLQKKMAEQQEVLLSTISDKINLMPNIVANHLRDNLEINGVVQVTSSDVMRIVATMEATLLRAIAGGQGAAVDAVISEAVIAPARSSFFESTWRLYKWRDGSEQYFPDTFKFPKCSVSVLWDLWHFGKTGTNDAPYRKLLATHIQCGTEKEVGTQKTYLSKAKTVTCSLVDAAMESGDYARKADILDLSYEISRELFDKCFIILCMRGYSIANEVLLDNLRVGEVTYLTFYDILTKPNRKRRVAQTV